MKSIDFKSLLIGILGTALVMVLMGVTSSGKNFQLACGPGKYRPECFVMNTKNGHVKLLKRESFSSNFKRIYIGIGDKF